MRKESAAFDAAVERFVDLVARPALRKRSAFNMAHRGARRVIENGKAM